MFGSYLSHFIRHIAASDYRKSNCRNVSTQYRQESLQYSWCASSWILTQAHRISLLSAIKLKPSTSALTPPLPTARVVSFLTYTSAAQSRLSRSRKIVFLRPAFSSCWLALDDISCNERSIPDLDRCSRSGSAFQCRSSCRGQPLASRISIQGICPLSCYNSSRIIHNKCPEFVNKLSTFFSRFLL